MSKRTCIFLLNVLSAAFIISCSEIRSKAEKTNNSDTSYFMPAQFEEQEAVWLGWEGYELFYPVNLNMVKTLMPYVTVRIISESDSISDVAKKILTADGIDTGRIRFYVFPDNEFWIRDHGAAFVVNNNGGMKAVDFKWSMYGYEDWVRTTYPNDTNRLKSVLETLRRSERHKVDSLMGAAENVPVEKSWITIEGGSIDVNGKGTLLLNEPLTLQRNKGAAKTDIETEFKRVLGVKNIIWLQHGLADDPHMWQVITGNYVGIGTGGHTDEYAKFADPSTILLAWVPEEEKDQHPVNRINYERMSINYEILKKAKDVDGKPFRIIKVPLPEPIVRKSVLVQKSQWDTSYSITASVFPASGWKVGDTVNRVAASSYLNYYVTNGLVLLPDYSSQGIKNRRKQEEVRKIFQDVFPGRKLVFIDAMPLNWSGGGIHCGTQQQPGRTSKIKSR